MGGKAVRYPQYPRPADSSERGNPDCSEAISGENRTSFLSEEEKEANPNAKDTNGYLKIMKSHECAQDWWDKLKDIDKKIILGIPNFDREIFKEITGIDVGEE